MTVHKLHLAGVRVRPAPQQILAEKQGITVTGKRNYGNYPRITPRGNYSDSLLNPQFSGRSAPIFNGTTVTAYSIPNFRLGCPNLQSRHAEEHPAKGRP